jgi:membrane-associated phospholipid phosphatase
VLRRATLTDHEYDQENLSMRAIVGHRTGGWHNTISLCVVPFSLLTLAAVALFVDLPVAKWVSVNRLPSFVREVFDATETFGHGVGAVCIITAIWTLDVRRHVAGMGLFAASIGSGLVANVVKLLISRQRPRAFTFITDNVFDTFGALLPLPAASSQSFPSAHAATAVGLAVGLAALYPRGRWLFGTFAVLACLSRVAVSAHFVSDVFVGAAIGWLVGQSCVRWRFKFSRRLQQEDFSRAYNVVSDVDNAAA